MGNCLPTPFLSRLGLGFCDSNSETDREYEYDYEEVVFVMTNTPQSYRFGNPATATPSLAGNIEPLNRLLADLSTRGTPKVWFISFCCVFLT